MSGKAREIGKVNQGLADQGIDPTDQRETDTPEEKHPPTFREMAATVFAEDEIRVANGRLSETRIREYRRALNRLLEGLDDNQREGIADKRLDIITRIDILNLMEWYFHNQFPTYQSMWGYARKIFMRAQRQWPTVSNPVDETVRGWLGPSDHKVEHYAFVPYHLVAETIDKIQGVTVPRALPGNLALLMVILTGCRGKEVRLMQYDQLRSKTITSPDQWNEPEGLWDPIDWERFDAGEDIGTIVWFIPGENTKTGEPRRVAMSSGGLEILREARPLHKRWSSPYVFPSPWSPHGHLADGALRHKCGRLNLAGTTHGFRTTLRIWWGEVGGNSDAGELQLGHVLGPVVRAYLRTDLLAERAEMMEAWAQYLRDELPPDWEWIPPRTAAKLRAMEEERNAIREQCEQLTLQVKELTAAVTGLVASLRAEGKARSEELLSMLPGALADLLGRQRSESPG